MWCDSPEELKITELKRRISDIKASIYDDLRKILQLQNEIREKDNKIMEYAIEINEIRAKMGNKPIFKSTIGGYYGLTSFCMWPEGYYLRKKTNGGE